MEDGLADIQPLALACRAVPDRKAKQGCDFVGAEPAPIIASVTPFPRAQSRNALIIAEGISCVLADIHDIAHLRHIAVERGGGETHLFGR